MREKSRGKRERERKGEERRQKESPIRDRAHSRLACPEAHDGFGPWPGVCEQQARKYVTFGLWVRTRRGLAHQAEECASVLACCSARRAVRMRAGRREGQCGWKGQSRPLRKCAGQRVRGAPSHGHTTLVQSCCDELRFQTSFMWFSAVCSTISMVKNTDSCCRYFWVSSIVQYDSQCDFYDKELR